ncbi:hypothetical protein [Murdochiella vaginalis]|uniref:hypothetical protein n=1 Tax=Murdochiella vaginalis TaxID=1852373 RepID=UPI0008FE1425|nr:hypothetical protein [Murdochiella vaginalis]
MQILTDEQGFITSFALDGMLVGGAECAEPEDIEDFALHYQCYRIRDGDLVLDKKRLVAKSKNAAKDAIRERRCKECFPVINRGTPWYDRLTEQQKKELNAWYLAWLDATETGAIPEMPEWLSTYYVLGGTR